MRRILSGVVILSVVLLLNGCDSISDMWDGLVDSISGSGDDKESTSSVTTTGTPATVTKTSSTPTVTKTSSTPTVTKTSSTPTVTKTSNRFDHYNPQAWDGHGVAVVLCGNDRRMDSCSLNGQAMSLHGSQDKGRDAWTIRGRSGYGGTITCKRGNDAYSFRVSGGGLTWGGCR